MKVLVKHVLPNPFRDMERYPMDPEKISKLRESYRTTTYWENLVVRKVDGGKVQLSAGHHRLQALREEYGPNHEIAVIGKPFTDEQMLQVMARENLTEWESNTAVLHETVRAAVLAYAEGTISLGKPPDKTPERQLRFAPSFIMGEKCPGNGAHPYTGQQLAKFLGIGEQRIAAALRGLELVERKILKPELITQFKPSRAEILIDETMTVLKKTDDPKAAREIGRVAAEILAERPASETKKSQRYAHTENEAEQRIRENRALVTAISPEARQKLTEKVEKKLPDISSFALKTSADVAALLGPDSTLHQSIHALIEAKADIPAAARKSLVRSLAGLIKQAVRFHEELEK